MLIIPRRRQGLEEVHRRFHRDLAEACRPDSATRISAVFLQNKGRFLLYGEYCSQLQPAQELVDDLCEKDDTLSQRVAVSGTGRPGRGGESYILS